jgi:hypothetical protein
MNFSEQWVMHFDSVSFSCFDENPYTQTQLQHKTFWSAKKQKLNMLAYPSPLGHHTLVETALHQVVVHPVFKERASKHAAAELVYNTAVPQRILHLLIFQMPHKFTLLTIGDITECVHDTVCSKWS